MELWAPLPKEYMWRPPHIHNTRMQTTFEMLLFNHTPLHQSHQTRNVLKYALPPPNKYMYIYTSMWCCVPRVLQLRGKLSSCVLTAQNRERARMLVRRATPDSSI